MLYSRNEGTRILEYDQSTLYTILKCHNETHYFVQLVQRKYKKIL
jgi:hypothetical protein